MEYRIKFSKRALRTFKSLPKETQKTLAPIIDSLASNPKPDGIVRMQEFKQCYRLRHGDYRIVYTIQDKQLIVVILAVGNRRDIYSEKEKTVIRKILQELAGEL